VKLLLTAYCCAPDSGSEQAFGWWWVTNCAERHEVTVVTPTAQRARIESALPLEGRSLRFVYVDGPPKVSAAGSSYRFERIQQYLWQLRTIPTLRRLVRDWRPDLCQHVTTGTWRQPTGLSFAGAPYVFGPTSGSERLPPGFLRRIGLQGAMTEYLRGQLINVSRFDPLVRRAMGRASALWAVGPATLGDLSARYPDKTFPTTRAFPHPALPRTDERPARPASTGGSFQLSWMGRLIPTKNLEILLEALADPRLSATRLAVIGDGPMAARYRAVAERVGVAARVEFLGRLDQRRAFEVVRESDAFVFTSVREMMGQSLSEAMQLGVACVILDCSGASSLVGDEGALKVQIGTYEATRAALADALASLVGNHEKLEELRAAAWRRIGALIDRERAADDRDRFFEALLRRGAGTLTTPDRVEGAPEHG